MKKTFLFISIVTFVLIQPLFILAQKNEKSFLTPEYKLGIGTLLYGHRGFAFSNELSLPVFKGFELGTSFVFGSTMPSGRVLAWYKDNDYSTSTVVIANSDIDFYNERSMYSISFMGYLRPLDFFKSSGLKNHSFKIGGGYGYHHQTITGISIANGISKLENLQVDIKSNFYPSFAVQYQYYINNKWVVGTEYLLFNPEGYGALNLLLGVRL